MSQLSFDSLLKQDYYSVSQITREIRAILETKFTPVWIQGEISNFTHHNSGHMYFSLKDADAQISCVMWNSRNQWLYFDPEDGMKVVVNGRVTVYEKRGAYQLDAWQMIPSGAGELQVAFEQLKARLRDEGLFDTERKRPLPRFPQRIGIVTSPTGAALRDLLSVIRRRFPAVEIILRPVAVQGEGAHIEIAEAISEFNAYGDVDVLIVGRGGGSLEDLWAFNEESVARAVHESEIPVVSAVGHEVDFTICDFVADLRAPTPSAAAELVVPSRDEIRDVLFECGKQLTQNMLEMIRYQRHKVESVRQSYAYRRPMDLIYEQVRRVDEMSRVLETGMRNNIAFQKEAVKSLEQRLSLLEHRNVLKRGYSLCFTEKERKLIRKADELSSQDRVELQFYEGRAAGVIEKVNTDTK